MITRYVCCCSLLCLIVPTLLLAQSPDEGMSPSKELVLKDPTVESPELKQSMEMVRGVQQLKVLQERMELLQAQNATLEKLLSEETKRSDLLLQSLDDRNKQLEKTRAIPRLVLSLLVETADSTRAVIEAGDWRYPIRGTHPIQIELSDGDWTEAVPSFPGQGVVVLSFTDLDVKRTLVYGISAMTSKQTSRRTAKSDRFESQ